MAMDKVSWYLILTKSSCIAYPLEKFATGCILHHDCQMCRCKYNLKHNICRESYKNLRRYILYQLISIYLFKSDDIGMPERPMVDDFSLHILINLTRERQRITNEFEETIYFNTETTLR